MGLGLIVKMLHVFAAIALFCGMAGRLVTFRRAGQAPGLGAALALLETSEWFERRLVIPASGLILLFGVLAAWRGQWPLLGFLQGAGSNWLLLSLVLFFALVPAIPLYLLPARQRRAQAAQAALAQGAVTPALAAALHDRGVIAYRAIELVVVVIITVLMVTKPF
jgi:hypothetical protein